jgi:chemotaxis protein CheD
LSPPKAGGHWQIGGQPGEHLVLMPGQMHVGQQVASVRTLLGSCVAITLWHPKRRIGGMCHFLLPQRQRRPGDALEGRYGDEAVEAMVKALQALRAEPCEFVAHLYGGADTMSGCSAVKFNIGERNIEQGWSLIDRYGFQLDGVDVGEDIPRVVSLALGSGEVTMRRGTGQAPDHLRDEPAAAPYPPASPGAWLATNTPTPRRT